MVEALDLRSGDPEFKSRSDHRLYLSQIVPGSTARLRLYKAHGCASCRLAFLNYSVHLLHFVSIFVVKVISSLPVSSPRNFPCFPESLPENAFIL